MSKAPSRNCGGRDAVLLQAKRRQRSSKTGAGMPPVFVLAPPLSGGSLLAAVLGRHPALYAVPETGLLAASTIEDYAGGYGESVAVRPAAARLFRQDGLLRAVAQLHAGEQTLDSVDMARRWLWVRRARSAVDVYRELCVKVAPRRLVEWGAAYVGRGAVLQRLIAAFPDAQFIHLVRHPRAFCEAVMARPAMALWALFQNSLDRRAPVPVLDPQIVWHDAHARITAAMNGLPAPQTCRVRVETLARDSSKMLKILCRWLGVSSAGDAVDAMRHPETSEFARLGPINARHGHDPDFLEQPTLGPHLAPPVSLAGSLGWRPDGAAFHPRVVGLAQSFGYT